MTPASALSLQGCPEAGKWTPHCTGASTSSSKWEGAGGEAPASCHCALGGSCSLGLALPGGSCYQNVCERSSGCSAAASRRSRVVKVWSGRLWSVRSRWRMEPGSALVVARMGGWVAVALLWLTPRCCGRGCDGPAVPAAAQTRVRGKTACWFGRCAQGRVSEAAGKLRGASSSSGRKLVPAQHSEARLELPVPAWPWQPPCVMRRERTQLWALSCAWNR